MKEPVAYTVKTRINFSTTQYVVLVYDKMSKTIYHRPSHAKSTFNIMKEKGEDVELQGNTLIHNTKLSQDKYCKFIEDELEKAKQNQNIRFKISYVKGGKN